MSKGDVRDTQPARRRHVEQDKQWTCNVTLLPWESNKYYLLVWVCSCVRVREYMWVSGRVRVANPARNAYAPYSDVICGPSVCTIFFDIP